MRALREQIDELDGLEVYGRVVGVRGLMVEVAGPLHAMSVGARVIVADEVSLGLAPRIVEEVFEVLRTAAQGGVTLIVIEQFVDQVLAFADEALILRRGELAWSGPAAQAYAAAEQHYLGTTATDR